MRNNGNGLTETKAQRWRALAIYQDGTEGLLFVGASFSQVSENYDNPFFDLLEDDERAKVKAIHLQKWFGAPDAGTWQTQRNLSIPEIPVLKIVRKPAPVLH